MKDDFHDFEADLNRTIADYVELQREVVESMTGAESIAQSIHDAVDDAVLAITSPIAPRAANSLDRFRSLPDEYIEPALDLFTARAFQELLPDMVRLENRIESLVDLAHQAAPSPRAAATLSKVVRCYLLGLDAEAIAMCRAALDVSVSDAVDSLDDGIVGPVPLSMKKRLDLLKASDRFADLDVTAALDVWYVGNEVLHNNIDSVNRAPEVFSKALRVIGSLFPEPTT